MKFSILCALILSFSFACSSGGQANVESNNTISPAPASNSANANQAAMTNVEAAKSVPYNGIQNLNPNAFNAGNANLKVVPVDSDKSRLPIGSRPAPDDSFFSATMNAKGQPVETRVFRNHPVLAKVEKTTTGKDAAYRVFLKNGKILEAPADKMADFAVSAPENILDAVGLIPKPQGNSSRSVDKIEVKQP